MNISTDEIYNLIYFDFLKRINIIMTNEKFKPYNYIASDKKSKQISFDGLSLLVQLHLSEN